MVAGAAAGLARYLGVDVMIVPSISPPTWVPQMCVGQGAWMCGLSCANACRCGDGACH
jgi:hypothetical protein